jgi:hypothetical protein
MTDNPTPDTLAALQTEWQQARRNTIYNGATYAADGLIDAQAARILELEAALADERRAREAGVSKLDEVRDECLFALSNPEAHYSAVRVYAAYEPYDDILAIVDPPPADPELEGCWEAWCAYLPSDKNGQPFIGYAEWKAQWKRQPAAPLTERGEEGEG